MRAGTHAHGMDVHTDTDADARTHTHTHGRTHACTHGRTHAIMPACTHGRMHGLHDRYQQTIEALRRDLSEERDRTSQLDGEVAKMEQLRSEAEMFKQAKHEIERNYFDIDRQLLSRVREVDALRAERAELQQQLEQCRADCTELSAVKTNADERAASMETRMAQVEEAHSMAVGETKKGFVEVEQWRRKLDAAEHQVAQLSRTKAEFEKELAKLKGDSTVIDELRSEVDASRCRTKRIYFRK